MTDSVAPVRRGRRGAWGGRRGMALALVAVVALSVLTVWLTAPRLGGLLDPAATSEDGAHALVSLLRDHGVDVVVASTAEDARRAADGDTLLLVGQTPFLTNDAQLETLAQAPGDRLLIDPGPRTRNVLAPGIRTAPLDPIYSEPDCDLREARQSGTVNLADPQAFTAVDPDTLDLTRCYAGTLVRYRNGDDVVTVIGAAQFMTNSGLLREGNAALAMNLAGVHPRLIWYAPQRSEGESDGAASIFDLIPDRVTWIVWQLLLVVVLVALWQGRRLGPLVADKLPVVVRASETVEGRGRLYRSRRARTQATAALRTAALQRLTPRLGLGPRATPAAIVAAVAARGGGEPAAVHQTLYGPPPASDDELLRLANALDDIERQVKRL